MAMCKSSSALAFASHRHEARRRPPTDAHWVPNTDVYVTDAGIVIKAEVAGLNRDDLTLTVEGNTLRISGSRIDGCREVGSKFHLMEIHYGAFENVVELPPGYDLAQARAAYQNGFLRVDVPLSKPIQPERPRRRLRPRRK
ncbi:MAG: Hsp20/alpha crystallin family protein [Verrucomicrobia bacterium]|nr:Hsp20/alpha crystallin family protein [Verrucomicrobiota bacterium]